METDFRRKRAGKTEFKPVKINSDSKVVVSEYHGSAHFHALVASDGFMMIPKDVTEIAAGMQVKVFLF